MKDTLNRRNFLRGSAVAGAAALATPAIADGHGTTLKMQAAWGGGIFLENAQSFAARVNEMSGGSLSGRGALRACLLVRQIQGGLALWDGSMLWLVVSGSAGLGPRRWRPGAV